MPVDLLPADADALVCAIMADADAALAAAKDALAARFGPILLQSAVYPFDYTDYYAPEMGDGLSKQLVYFEEPVDPAALPEIKHRTMELEKELGRREEGRILRRANIDPGLVSIESLVLATTKRSGHRVCIAPSLYAEVTLLFQKGRYTPLQWTYPDYRTEAVQVFLQQVRTHLMQQRRR